MVPFSGDAGSLSSSQAGSKLSFLEVGTHFFYPPPKCANENASGAVVGHNLGSNVLASGPVGVEQGIRR